MRRLFPSSLPVTELVPLQKETPVHEEETVTSSADPDHSIIVVQSIYAATRQRQRYCVILGGLAVLLLFIGYAQSRLVEYYGGAREKNKNNKFDLDKEYLTIAIDHEGSCPKGCAFVHWILPPHIRYRYVEIDKLSDTEYGHLLFVARGNAKTLSRISLAHRARGYSVGLFLMADEQLNNRGFLEYHADFDYVLRHYYSSKEDNWLALGNHTCGSNKLSLPYSKTWWTKAVLPRWGIHWVFLPINPAKVDLQGLSARPAASGWPVGKRPVDCSFSGRLTPARTKMKDVFADSDLDCDIALSGGFMQGEDSWNYIWSLTSTKMGLTPPGNNNETHRLAELLENGVIPVLLDSDFLHAPFRRVPGIVRDNWTSAIDEMRRLLHNRENMNELEAMQQDAFQFYEDLKRCMTQDLDFIVGGAFREAKERRWKHGG